MVRWILFFAILPNLLWCSSRKQSRDETPSLEPQPEKIAKPKKEDTSPKSDVKEKKTHVDTSPELPKAPLPESKTEDPKMPPQTTKNEEVKKTPLLEPKLPACEVILKANHPKHILSDFAFANGTQKIYAKYSEKDSSASKSMIVTDITDLNDKQIPGHYTVWELNQFLKNKFTLCLDKVFKTRESVAAQGFSNLTNFQNESLMMIRSLPAKYHGFYAKIANPEHAKYFVPDGSHYPLKCSKLYDTVFDKYIPHSTHQEREQYREKCKSEKLYCKDLHFKTQMGTHTLELNQPLHSIDEWLSFKDFDAYNLFINTEWFSIVDFGPHDTPCSRSFGLEFSEGRRIGTSLTNTGEKLDAFGVTFHNKVEFINRDLVESRSSELNFGFSGSIVFEHGLAKTPQQIMHPKELTARAVIAFDKEGHLIFLAGAHELNLASVQDFLVKDLEARDIMMLDGGGSTHLHYREGTRVWHLNRKDKQGFRPLTSFFGIGTQHHSFEIVEP